MKNLQRIISSCLTTTLILMCIIPVRFTTAQGDGDILSPIPQQEVESDPQESAPDISLDANTSVTTEVTTESSAGNNEAGDVKQEDTAGEPSPEPTQISSNTNILTDTPSPAPEDIEENGTPTEDIPSDSQQDATFIDPAENQKLPDAESSASAAAVSQESQVVTDTLTSSNTGNNSTQPPSEGSTPENAETLSDTKKTEAHSSSTIQTADAVSIATVETDVNTLLVQSDIVYHTINLFLDQNGDIDVSLPADIARRLIESDPDSEVIHAALTHIDSEADVDTTVTTQADSGNNSASSDDTVTIQSGDAAALLSLFNRINLYMIDSVIHVVVINIFGNLSGNILLPDLLYGSKETCAGCGTITSQQHADIVNTITTTADTGNNTVSAMTSDINTGQAYAAANTVNIVNTVVYGSELLRLIITPFGTWNGSFLGWTKDGEERVLSDYDSTPLCESCSPDIDMIQNAHVTNTVTTTASTGTNNASAREAQIETGNAYAVSSITNLVNSIFVKSFGFIGFVNVFGSWTGDIGSASLFQEPPAPSEPSNGQESAQSPAGDEIREDGGLLEVTNEHNVGTYVYPGDTVTMFIRVKNPGEGRMFETKLILMLIKDGVEAGTSVFDLGAIKPHKAINITTGMVLSPNAPAGEYTVRAAAYGFAGQNHTKISAYKDSMFTVWGGQINQSRMETNEDHERTNPPTVLGVTTPESPKETNILYALLTLIILLPEYVAIRIPIARGELYRFLSFNIPLRERFAALRLFLL